MALPGTREQKVWFFQVTTPGVRLLTYNLPNQNTFQNLVSSAAFILNSEDSADVAQTQQGLVLKSIAVDILNATDTKDLGFGALALSVSPMQLPTVALTGGIVGVSQNVTTGALIYTLPAYLLASDGDVLFTSLTTGNILQYNGSKWVNVPIFFQTIESNLTPVTQRPKLNFSTTFGVTDDSGHTCTTITITTNGITYSLIQQTSGGNVLLGNSTGGAANVSEQTVGAELTLSGGSLTITTNGVTYAKIQQASTGYVLLGNPTAGAANYKETAIAAELAFTGGTTLGIATNGVTYAKIQQTSAGKVLIGNSTGEAADVGEITVVGLNLASGVLSSNGIKSITGSHAYQVLNTDFINGLILCLSYSDSAVATVTMCNPATVPPGVQLLIKICTGLGNVVTINAYAGELFDGASTKVINSPSTYGYVRLFTDGTNWKVV